MREVEKIIADNPGPWEAIILPELKPARPYVLGISGLPGSGKSRLSRALWTNRRDAFYIGGENITFAMFNVGKPTASQYVEAYDWIYKLIDSIVQEGYGVIFDSTNPQKTYRDRLRKLAGDRAPVFFAQLVARDGTLLKRLAERPVSDDPQTVARNFPPATLFEFKRTFEALRPDEGVVIDTEVNDLDGQIAIINQNI